MEEINNWERNGVFKEVKTQGQRTINTRWVATEKMKEEGVEWRKDIMLNWIVMA